MKEITTRIVEPRRDSLLTSLPAAWRHGGGDGGGGWRRGADSTESTSCTLNGPRHDYNYHKHVTHTQRSTDCRVGRTAATDLSTRVTAYLPLRVLQSSESVINYTFGFGGILLSS